MLRHSSRMNLFSFLRYKVNFSKVHFPPGVYRTAPSPLPCLPDTSQHVHYIIIKVLQPDYLYHTAVGISHRKANYVKGELPK